jgi:hypothetical protein
MERVSKVFKEVAGGRRGGADLRDVVAKHPGHKGGGIQLNTLRAWEAEGLVKLRTQFEGKALVVKECKLTHDGARTAKEAIARYA